MDLAYIRQQIDELYEMCLTIKEPFHVKKDLFILPDETADNIFSKTQINLHGHWVCIDNFGLIHILAQHGNPVSEAKRGQIAITKEDLYHVVDAVLYPDEISYVGEAKRTRLPLIQFKKVVGNQVITIKEVRTITSTKKQKVSRLMLQTMYKKPNK